MGARLSRSEDASRGRLQVTGADGEERRAGRETSGPGIGAEPAVSVCLKEKT